MLYVFLLMLPTDVLAMLQDSLLFMKHKPEAVDATQALIVFSRVGVYMRVPGVDAERFAEAVQSQGILGYIDTLSGGSLSRVGIFSLGTPHAQIWPACLLAHWRLLKHCGHIRSSLVGCATPWMPMNRMQAPALIHGSAGSTVELHSMPRCLVGLLRFAQPVPGSF